MKTTDLMIGDWVLAKGKPTRVEDVDESEGINREWIAGCEDGGCIPMEKIEPIPLTPEILKKNYGKEMRVGISDKPCWGEMGAIWSTMLWKCENSFWLEVSTIADGFVKKHILYVHELQHALRLAGIKKEIVL